MPLLRCITCQAEGRLPASAAGKTVRCPRCGTRQRVSGSDAGPLEASRAERSRSSRAERVRSSRAERGRSSRSERGRSSRSERSRSSASAQGIRQSCGACGEVFRAPKELAGRRVRCPQCKEPVRIAGARPQSPAEQSPAEQSPVEQSPVEQSSAKPTSSSSRRSPALVTRRGGLIALLLGLCLVPLLLGSFRSPNDTKQRFEQTIEENSGSLGHLGEDASLDEVLGALPERRIMGAFLPRDTSLHWAFAAVAGFVFLGLALRAFPRGSTTFEELIVAAVFTGTFGIFLLLTLQVLAAVVTAFSGFSTSSLAILVYVVNFVGYCYQLALDPAAGAFDSTMGYIFSVGLCEELCKALPIVWLVRKAERPLGWRDLCLIGLASGVGFGVSEGIHYSTEYYNGIHYGSIYVIRFVSCVALHATWAATIGLLLSATQHQLRPGRSPLQLVGALCAAIWAPMVLHGLYDAALKLELRWLALLCALVSVLYLGWLIVSAEQGRGVAKVLAKVQTA